MGRRALIAAMLVAAATPSAHAGPRDADEAISIEGLVDLAVRKSTQLKRVRARRQIAGLGGVIAAGSGEVQVRASAEVDTRREAPIANTRAQVIEDTRVSGSVSIGKLLPTGGELMLSLSSMEQLRRFGEAPDAPASATLHRVGMSVRQPLLRGRGQGAQVDERKAAVAADATTLEAEDQHAAAILELVDAYWELAYHRATLRVRKQSLALAQRQVELTRKMHARGAVPDSAIKAARYGVALREEALLRAQDAVQSASLLLRRLAGLELTVEAGDLAPTDALVIPASVPELGEMIELAIARSPRVQAARLGIALADVELAKRRNAALPALDLSASAGAVGVGSDPGSALSALGTGTSYEIGGALSLAWGLGGSARASAETARLERASARISATEVERVVVATVIDVVRRVRAARQRAEVAEHAIELATANLETELALFRADKSSNVLVFERQAEADEARLLAVRAAADAQIALATLAYLTGGLLDTLGVAIKPAARRASARTARR